MTFASPSTDTNTTPYHLATYEGITEIYPELFASISASHKVWARKQLKIAKNKRHELTLRKGRRPVYTKPKGYSTKKPVRNTVRFNRK